MLSDIETRLYHSEGESHCAMGKNFSAGHCLATPADARPQAGGMGFIEHNKSLCMLSVLINTHMLEASKHHEVKKYFYSSSACVYPDYRQQETNITALKESDAYPAMPEDGYGWEKLFSERLCKNFEEDFGFVSRVFRFYNVYGHSGTWDGGR